MAKQPRPGQEAKSPIYKRLWFAIAVAVAAGLLTLTFIGWLWGEGGIFSLRRIFSFWILDLHAIDKAEYIKSALALVGGIGGVVYLVVKYRERAAAERDEARADRKEAEERLLAAVQQLGSESPQVRIAGVYALADVADTYLGDYKQRVVNILCGYLRTERRTPAERLVQDNITRDVETIEVYHSQLLHSFEDAAVESTVLEVMSGHIRRPTSPSQPSTLKPEQSWSHCKFDFHGAHFVEPIPFDVCVFEEDVNFGGCRFGSDVYFDHITFNGSARFGGSTFHSWASFHRSAFNDTSCFTDSTFYNWASFEGSTFNGQASFDDSTFEKSATFKRCTFNDWASFVGSTFNGEASFDDSAFNDTASLDDSTFNGEASFDDSIFENWTGFSDSTFNGEASFECTTFNDWASFEGSTFNGEASFDGSTFNDWASFDGSTFNRREQMDYEDSIGHSPFGSLPLEENGLPKGARWDDEPVPSDDDTAPEDSPPDGDTALPDEH